MTADLPSERKPARKISKRGNSWRPIKNERLIEVACSLGAALACGLAETAGRHLTDLAMMLTQNPLPAFGIGGAAFGAAVVSRRGRKTIAESLRWVVHFLKRSAS